MDPKQDAERQIFNLRQRAGTFLRTNDIEEYNRIIIRISELQQQNDAVKGEKKENPSGR
jgi:hypothetical protein